MSKRRRMVEEITPEHPPTLSPLINMSNGGTAATSPPALGMQALAHTPNPLMLRAKADMLDGMDMRSILDPSAEFDLAMTGAVPIPNKTPVATASLTEGPLGDVIRERLGRDVTSEDLAEHGITGSTLPLSNATQDGLVPLPASVQVVPPDGHSDPDDRVQRYVTGQSPFYYNERRARSGIETQLKRQGWEKDHCPHCHRLIDEVTSMRKSGAKPSPGDLSLCLYCGGALTWDDRMRMVIPPEDQIVRAHAEIEDFTKLQALIRLKLIFRVDASLAVVDGCH